MSYFFKKAPEAQVEKGDQSQATSAESAKVQAAKEEISEDKEELDKLFMGEEEDEEFLIEEDSAAYLATRRNIFIDPSQRLGSRPLRLTLEDCIRIALVNNNKVQSTDYNVDVARARHMEAEARFWPIFEYEWLTAPVPKNISDALGSFFRGDLLWWNKVRIAMGIPLYSFGKLSIAKDLALGGITAAREERKKERLSTVTKVRYLYYGVLLAEELGRLLTQAHNKLSREVEKRKAEKGSPISMIRAKVFLVDLEGRLAEARDKELMALEGLRVQLGLNPDVAVMVYSEKLRPIRFRLRPIDDYIEMALRNRPDVKLVEVGLETRRKLYTLEKRRFFPDVGFGAYFDIGRTAGNVLGVTTTDDYSDPLNFSRAGIGMRVQGKFDVHGQKARVNRAQSEYYKASLEHYMAKDGIALDIKKAHMDASRNFDDVERAAKSERLARQLFFLTQSNYELGIGVEEEYVEALQLVLMSRGKYFEAVFDYNSSLAVLDEKAGIIPEVGDPLDNKDRQIDMSLPRKHYYTESAEPYKWDSDVQDDKEE